MGAKIHSFLQKLGYHFNDEALISEAFRHSSYVNEQADSGLRDNERLEFLGDAVLNLVVGHLLMQRYPEMKDLLLACREKAPIKIWNAADIGVTTADIGLQGSLTHVIKTFAPKAERQAEMLAGDTPTVARELVQRLHSQKLV